MPPIEEVFARVLSERESVAGRTLTEREQDVIQAIVVSGLGRSGAAVTLDLSIKTVDAHLLHIREKLGYADQQEMARELLIAWVRASTLGEVVSP